MYDHLEIPDFLKRGPDTPEQKAARLASYRAQPLTASSRFGWRPSKRNKKRDERECEATLERWRLEYLAEKIADQKKGG